MNESKELTIEAKIENVDKVISFINATLQDHGCTFEMSFSGKSRN